MHSHHPFLLLFKLSPRMALIGFGLLVVFNPVTIGIVVALLDTFTGTNIGGMIAGTTTPRQQQGICHLYVNGHHFIVATDCSRVKFPGKEVPA